MNRNVGWNLMAMFAFLVASSSGSICQDSLQGAPSEQDKQSIYSGPQVDEQLSPFSVTLALGESAGKTIDPVKLAQGKPMLLVFLQDVNRQSISLTRVLTQYAQSRAKDGLNTTVILLGDDATGAQNTITRIKHALTQSVATGVSPDGREGPGSYGLNRSVQLTILVANKDRVTANFALVQPSLQVDLPRVVKAIIEQIGGTEPKLSDLLESPSDSTKPDPEAIRALMRPLIQRDADTKEVDKAAEAIEQAIAKSTAIQKEIGRIASTIVGSGKLENYGTEHAQGYLKRWAEKYGQQPKRPQDDPKSL
ncbi:MAG: hypothetical protein ACKN9S_13915 [Pirellula sp.]